MINIPRIIWVNKNWTTKQFHLEVLKFFKRIFLNWYDIFSSGKFNRDMVPPPPFQHPSIDEVKRPLTKEEFL
jgi:hypothetical protein